MKSNTLGVRIVAKERFYSVNMTGPTTKLENDKKNICMIQIILKLGDPFQSVKNDIFFDWPELLVCLPPKLVS